MKKNWLKVTSKVIAVVTASALLLSVVACGKDTTSSEDKSTAAAESTAKASDEKVDLKLITWVQETNEKAIGTLNDGFKAKYPNVSFTIDTVAPNDFPTLLNTRISAGDVDILSNVAPFDQRVQDYMKGVDKPAWQTFVEGGNFLDITNEPFVKNWDPGMLSQVTWDGKIYGLDMGAVGYNGVFYNKKLFADLGLQEPGTWDEFVKVCDAIKAKGIAPITLGMADVWPILIVSTGMVGANEPDIDAFLKGLWTGERKFNDEKTLKVFEREAQFVSYLEQGVNAVAYGDAPGRMVAGKAAMVYDGTWNAGTYSALDPNFEVGYFAIPGDTNGNPNQLQGKYDMMFMLYSKSENKDWGLKWMDFLSQKDNYEPFVSTCGFIPTMTGAKSSNKVIASIQDKATGFKIGFERVCVVPKGVGQYGGAQGFNFQLTKALGGTVADYKELANLAQKDWDDAKAASK